MNNKIRIISLLNFPLHARTTEINKESEINPNKRNTVVRRPQYISIKRIVYTPPPLRSSKVVYVSIKRINMVNCR